LVLNSGKVFGATSSGGGDGSGTIYTIDLSPELCVVLFSDGGPQVSVKSFLGQALQIQTAANLTGTWEILTNLVLTNNGGQFSDISATNLSQRFYRVLAQ